MNLVQWSWKVNCYHSYLAKAFYIKLMPAPCNLVMTLTESMFMSRRRMQKQEPAIPVVPVSVCME